MKFFYPAFLWLLAGPALAQTTTTDGLQPVQSIPLGTHAALAGTIQLPNHQAVLLLTDTESPKVHLHCLAPDGSTAWRTDVERFQQFTPDLPYGPIGETLTVLPRADVKKQMEALRQTQLAGLQVLTDGNTLYVVERIGMLSNKEEKANPTLAYGQVYVHRIDEKGQLSRVMFEHQRHPDYKIMTRETLGRYADGGGYVEIERARNEKEKTEQFSLVHFDPATRQLRLEPLALPGTPDTKGLGYFRNWFQDWAYLGHLPNKTYFCRNLLLAEDPSKRSQQPATYEVLVVDDSGRKVGGFSTTLNLTAGTTVCHSGQLHNAGELDHIPNLYTVTNVSTGSMATGPSSSVSRTTSRSATHDAWDTFNGNMGNFWLDRATGDVVIAGEYGQGSSPTELPALRGYFQRRYSPTGQASEQLQMAYPEDFRKDKKNNLFLGAYTDRNLRQARFHHDPLTNQNQYSFWMNTLYGTAQLVELNIDPTGKFQRADFSDKIDIQDKIYTVVMVAEPSWPSKNTDQGHDYRLFEHAGKDDAPVYAALEKRRRAGGTKLPFQEFHLVPNGNSGLVVERQQAVGGSLQVYKF